MKKIVWGGVLLIIALVLVILFVPAEQPKEAVKEVPTIFPVSPLDATYNIDDVGVTLVNGFATMPAAPNSVETVETKVFGQPVVGDLDADGDSDALLLLQQTAGGTGIFYYVVAATNTGNGYRGSNALFLGDRIAPQTIEIKNGTGIANYADRGPTEPFSTKPSFGKSLYVHLSGAMLSEVVAP